MTLTELIAALRSEIVRLDDDAVRNELAPVLPESELAGLVPRLRGAVTKVADGLEGQAGPEAPSRGK